MRGILPFSHNITARGPIQGVEDNERGLMGRSIKLLQMTSQIVVGSIAAQQERARTTSTAAQAKTSHYVGPTQTPQIEAAPFCMPRLLMSADDRSHSSSSAPPPPPSGSGGNQDDGSRPRITGLGQVPALTGTRGEIERKILEMGDYDELLTTIATDMALISLTPDDTEAAVEQIGYLSELLETMDEALKVHKFDESRIIGTLHFMAASLKEVAEIYDSAGSGRMTETNPNDALIPLLRVTDLAERRLLYKDLLTDEIAEKLADIYAIVATRGMPYDLESASRHSEERYSYLVALTALQLMGAARRYASLGRVDKVRSIAGIFETFKEAHSLPADGKRWALDVFEKFIRARAEGVTDRGISRKEMEKRRAFLDTSISIMMYGNYVFSDEITITAAEILREHGIDDLAQKFAEYIEYNRDFAAKSNLERGN